VSYDGEQNEPIQRELDDKAMQSNNPIANIENSIYFVELYRLLPLRNILVGLSEYELRLLLLRKVEEMTFEEIALDVSGNAYQIEHDFNKLMAKIRARALKEQVATARKRAGFYEP
jgi:hypothetical protein